MGKIRVQPLDPEITEENPFQHDLLYRQKMVESLTHLVSSIEGPCVIAVDAPWGAGKTTFLKMWSRHLSKQKFAVVEFNAWETDFSEDPFVALCAELTMVLGEKADDALSGDIDKVKETAQVVLRHLTSNAVRHITAGFIDINAITTDLAKQVAETQIQKRLDEYRDAQKAIKEFRMALKEMAHKLSKNGEVETSPKDKAVTEKRHGPLMVMVDELDRCRPSYAIEFLETAKHLFSVDQVIFVLAMNRTELQHAVKALYGNEFGAEAYLHRFIDVDLHLPEPNLDKFIDGLLVSFALDKDSWFQRLLKIFLSASPLTLRDIAQAVHRLGLVLNSLPDIHANIVKMIPIALILRTLDESLYHQFAKRIVSANDVAENIFNIPSITPLRWTKEGIWFQTGIMLAGREMTGNVESVLEEIIRQHIADEEDIMLKKGLQSALSFATQQLQGTYVTTPVFQSAYQHIEQMFSIIGGGSE